VRPIGGNRESLDAQLQQAGAGLAHREPERLALYPMSAAVPASEQCHELEVEAR
jgi:hypothetical protein